MNMGVFYQSGHKYAACYKALEQLRNIYPNLLVDLYEDGSKILSPVAKKFNCNYTELDQSGINSSHSGRPIYNLETNLVFLRRIYKSCREFLKGCDYILYYEDDVWCRRSIQRQPRFDLSGSLGPLYTNELYDYLKQRFNVTDDSRNVWSKHGSLQNYQACGGTIFRREKFIEAYEKISEIDWNVVYKLDTRPVEWSDASISFMFQHAGCSVGRWDDWGQYDTKNKGNWYDKTGWTIPMEEQEDVAFLHAYKHYYNYSKEDVICESI